MRTSEESLQDGGVDVLKCEIVSWLRTRPSCLRVNTLMMPSLPPHHSDLWKNNLHYRTDGRKIQYCTLPYRSSSYLLFASLAFQIMGSKSLRGKEVRRRKEGEDETIHQDEKLMLRQRQVAKMFKPVTFLASLLHTLILPILNKIPEVGKS